MVGLVIGILLTEILKIQEVDLILRKGDPPRITDIGIVRAV
jgi:hypothetical protein